MSTKFYDINAGKSLCQPWRWWMNFIILLIYLWLLRWNFKYVCFLFQQNLFHILWLLLFNVNSFLIISITVYESFSITFQIVGKRISFFENLCASRQPVTEWCSKNLFQIEEKVYTRSCWHDRVIVLCVFGFRFWQ